MTRRNRRRRILRILRHVFFGSAIFSKAAAAAVVPAPHAVPGEAWRSVRLEMELEQKLRALSRPLATMIAEALVRREDLIDTARGSYDVAGTGEIDALDSFWLAYGSFVNNEALTSLVETRNVRGTLPAVGDTARIWLATGSFGGRDGGRDEGGRDEGGKDEGGKEHGGKDEGGKDHGGKDEGGKDHGGKDHGGKDHGGKDHGGKDHGGKDHGGKDHDHYDD